MYSSVRLLFLVVSWVLVSATDEFRLVINNRLRRGQDNVTDNKDFDALKFLERIGYLDDVLNTTHRHHAPDNVRRALREFQQHAGISLTGRLDKATLDLMKRPRCGVPDVVKPSQRLDKNAPEPYVLKASEWPKNDLTYKWTRISERVMDREDIRRVVREAFEKWSRVTPLNFRETSGSADIELAFVGKNDPEPCAKDSGPSGMLAHAFRRKMGDKQSGNIHFDDAEPWAVKGQENPHRISLEHVALHEIGHSLGLGHSDDPDSVMVAWYPGPTELAEDDIRGIQKMYGTRRDGSLTPLENYCHLRFDAIAHGFGGDLFAFAGQHYYLITRNGLVRKRKIQDWFKGAPSSPDAVLFDRMSDRLYFFKGKYYYRFWDYKLEKGFPMLLAKPFQNIDAALMRFDQQFYLFKGDQITRWEHRMERYPSGYPKNIKTFYGNTAPDKIDAAIEYNNGITYLFKDDRYWKYVVYKRHEQPSPGYPKSILPFWLHCGFVEGRDEEPIFGYVG